MTAGPNGRLRVLFLVAVAVGAFWLSQPAALAGLCAVLAALWLAVGLPAVRLGRQVRKLWAFALLVVGSYALSAHDPASDRWLHPDWLGGAIGLNVHGAAQGASMVLRILAVVLASQLARAGDPRAIAAGLRGFGLPVPAAQSLDTVLALLGDAGRGGGRGDGSGGGRGRGAGDEGFWEALKRLSRGDVEPLARRLEQQIARAEAHVGPAGRDVAVVSGVSLTMLGTKAVKTLPGVPFAPGHKLVVLMPLYVVASLLTRTRLGATATGLNMGTVSFLLGDGRYGVFEILKHLTPGLLCDLLVPVLTAPGREPGGLAWSVFGGIVAVGRFATIVAVVWLVEAPAVAWAILAPGLLANVVFGSLSGYVTHHLVRAARRVRDESSPRPTGVPA